MCDDDRKPFDLWANVEKKEERDEFGKIYYVQQGPMGTRKEIPGIPTTKTETRLGNSFSITVEETDNRTGEVINTETKPLFGPLNDEE